MRRGGGVGRAAAPFSNLTAPKVPMTTTSLSNQEAAVMGPPTTSTPDKPHNPSSTGDPAATPPTAAPAVFAAPSESQGT